MQRILVVEDNGLNSMLFSTILERAGFEVEVAGTVNEAVQSLEARPPGLILLDTGLPDGSGLMLVRHLRQSPPLRHIPVIAVSGNSDEAAISAAMQAGCAAYLVKPVSAHVLTAAVLDHIRAVEPLFAPAPPPAAG